MDIIEFNEKNNKMKKLFLLLLIAPVLGFGQGEQRYADGTATDQDGNNFEWINYGTQDWAIENAEVVTYRDGTPIAYEPNASDYLNLTSGVWSYYWNNTNNTKLYNWYAVSGIHDDDENTPAKEFAPNGWRVPSKADWTILENYLIENGYNFDGTTTGNKIAKSMASTSGWDSSTTTGAVGNDLNLNNKSGFNVLPVGIREIGVGDGWEGEYSAFWCSDEEDNINGWFRELDYSYSGFYDHNELKQNGFSVRFVRDASTANSHDYSNAITIYPNPTTSIVTLQGGKQYDIDVYTLQGKKVMALTGNTIDMSHLSSATYIVKALDKVENEEASYKVVKN